MIDKTVRTAGSSSVAEGETVASQAFPEDAPFVHAFARVCSAGFAQGWHEANGGNLSYRLSPDDIAACKDILDAHGPSAHEGDPWHALARQAFVPELSGEYLLVTRAGCFMSNVEGDVAANSAIVQVSSAGNAWRLVCGLARGGRPTSELPTHLLGHAARFRATGGAERVVYHAHCPNVIALSTLIKPDERAWTRILWKSMTECVIVFPEGVGVIPWMLPGSLEIAQATSEKLSSHRAIVWTQHGMFVTGADFDAAFGLMHTIEKAAGLYLSARAANGGAEPPERVSDEQLRAVCASLGTVPNESCLEGRA